ncbi:ABC transporter permease [bacterium]|nr:ABC transporter permease [bacterium]
MFDKVKQLYKRRELIKNLVFRDLDVKYKGSFLGFIWSLLNPICMLIVFTIAFHYILKSGIQRFPLFFMCGYLPWMFFCASSTLSVTSIIFNPNLVQKIYFPREILPISTVLATLIEFILQLVIFLPIVFYFGHPPGFSIFLLPLLIIFQTIFIIGFGLLVSSLCVYLRDVKHLLDILLMMWFWLIPIVYENSLVQSIKIGSNFLTNTIKLIILHNPLSCFIISYKSIILSNSVPSSLRWGEMVFFSFAAIILGKYIFDKLSGEFAENI